jgi:hypothetical protein
MSDSPLDAEVIARLLAAADLAAQRPWSFEAADVYRYAADVAAGAVTIGTTEVARHRWSRRSKYRLASVVLVAAVVVTLFVAPLPSLHLVGGGRGSLAPGGNHKGSTTVTTKPVVSPGPAHPPACTSSVDGVTTAPSGAIVTLPLRAGHIITRSKALAIASSPGQMKAVDAKLSSFTEVKALLAASNPEQLQTPSEQVAAPWKPIWAVITEATGQPATAEDFGAELLVLVDAASGHVDLRVSAGVHPAWFKVLTDRSSPRCAGGSAVRLPFGVLTRTEEAYTVRRQNGANTGANLGSTTVELKLTYLRDFYRVDAAFFGGCLHMNCHLEELLWLPLDVVSAAPGKTLACLPPSASYPPGYRPKQVKQYYTMGFGGNDEIDCSGPPRWFSVLKDLAPPVKVPNDQSAG